MTKRKQHGKYFKATYKEVRKSFTVLEADIADLMLKRLSSIQTATALSWDKRSLFLYAARDVLEFLEEKTNCDIVLIRD
jgi:hypothetical protein